MLHLMDPKKIFPSYALVTTAISVAVFVIIQRLFSLNWEVYKIVTLSSTISSIFTLILFSTPAPRIVWRLLCRWNRDVYPDLTGFWVGKIFPASETEEAKEAVPS